MDSIKYLLTRFSRINNLRKEDYPFGFGNLGLTTDKPQAYSVVGFKEGAESYRGTNEVSYNRLDLATLFKNVPPVLTMFQPKNHREIFRELLWVYGLPGANDDAVLDEVTNTVVDWKNTPPEVTLAITKGNFYSGSLKVAIIQKVMPLDEIVVIRDLPLMTDKYSLMTTDLRLERHFYHYDFTFSPYIDVLRAVRAGAYLNLDFVNDPDVRQECGNIVFSPRLSSHTGVPYNIYDRNGCPCKYNGPARDWPGANAEYKYVAVYPPATKCVGDFLFHYN